MEITTKDDWGEQYKGKLEDFISKKYLVDGNLETIEYNLKSTIEHLEVMIYVLYDKGVLDKEDISKIIGGNVINVSL
jgi:hypothetical protein